MALRAAVLWALVSVLVSCESSPARPYAPPKAGPVAALHLAGENAAGDLSMAIYDNPSTECPSSKVGYLGYIKRSTKQPGAAIPIPAGRRIQLSPGYWEGRRFCTNFESYSLAPEAGQSYRVRLRIRIEALSCKPDGGRPVPERCGTLLTEIEQQYCEFHVEQQKAAEWAAAPEVIPLSFNPKCRDPSGK